MRELATNNGIELDDSFNWDSDIKKRNVRTRLMSKSSKNLNSMLLDKKEVSVEDYRRNSSLRKKIL